MRTTRSWTSRFAAGFAVAAGFLIIWANGAVGMIGNEDNPYNLLFLGAIAVALLGAVVARFRAAGMALAMLAAGLLHAGIALGGWSADPIGARFSLGFAFLWFLSAALFRKAAQDRATVVRQVRCSASSRIDAHSSSRTGETERRDWRSISRPARRGSAFIAFSVTGRSSGHTGSTATETQFESFGSGAAARATRITPTAALSAPLW
jgi:hypothetical protein